MCACLHIGYCPLGTPPAPPPAGGHPQHEIAAAPCLRLGRQGRPSTAAEENLCLTEGILTALISRVQRHLATVRQQPLAIGDHGHSQRHLYHQEQINSPLSPMR